MWPSTIPQLSRSFLHAMLVVVLIRATSTPAEIAKGVIQFSSPDGYAMVVGVLVDGAGPFKFLFDTGSTNTVVDPYIVRVLRLHKTGRRTAVTITGSTPMEVALLNEIEFGPTRTGRLEVIVDPLVAVKALDPTIHGILGQDVLSRMDYLIDNKSRIVQPDLTGEIADQTAGVVIRTMVITRSEDRSVAGITVMAEVLDAEPRRMRLLLDSGSAFPMLLSRTRSGAFRDLHANNLVTDEARSQTGSAVAMKSIRIGELLFQTEVRITSSSLGGLPIEGLLPTSCFNKVYVSNSKRFVVFLPKPEQNPAGARHRESTGNRTECRMS